MIGRDSDTDLVLRFQLDRGISAEAGCYVVTLGPSCKGCLLQAAWGT